MKMFSERILQEGLNFSWRCFARLEGAFTKDLFELAKKAGCGDIWFGLESGNQRVLDFIKKGINIETAKRVIVDCHNAGINANLQMMMGLPSETMQEALDTIKFLIEHQGYIKYVGFNVYYLTPACEVYLKPKEFGISYQNRPDVPFKFFHEFSHITGELPLKKAYEFLDLCYKLHHKEKKQTEHKKQQDFQDSKSNFTKYNFFLAVENESAFLEYYFNKDTKEGFVLEGNTKEEEDVRV